MISMKRKSRKKCDKLSILILILMLLTIVTITLTFGTERSPNSNPPFSGIIISIILLLCFLISVYYKLKKKK